MRHYRHIPASLGCLLVLAACASPDVPARLPATPDLPATAPAATVEPLVLDVDPGLRGSIAIDGSSTVFPITEAFVRQFVAQAPNVGVQLGVSGTSGGFKKFCLGETQISDASRPIKQSEIEQCEAAGIDFVELPIGYDGVSVVVNPNVTWVDCITVEELRQIWQPSAEGAIMRWNQVRASWPDQPLALYGPGGDSGTYDYFTSAVVGTEGSSRADYIGSEDDYLIAQDVLGDEYGLGFFGFAYSQEYDGQLRTLAIDSGNGCIAPSEETILGGTYQPLARPLFIYVQEHALGDPAVQAFVSNYIAFARQLALQVHSVPLPESAYPLVAERARMRRTGSVFSGGSQVGVSVTDLLRLEGNP